jgi:hypothetical protein
MNVTAKINRLKLKHNKKMSELENKSREITQLQSKETKECKINIKTRFINQRIE